MSTDTTTTQTPVVVQARVDLAALKPIVAAINPKREFVRWAKTSRVQSSIRKELATLTKGSTWACMHAHTKSVSHAERDVM